MFTAKYAGAGANTLFCNPMLQGLSDLVGGEGIAIEKVTSAVPQFDSPVIEAGTSVLWRHDYNGVPIPRDRPDIGPFQHRRPLKSDERVLDLRPRCSCPGRSKDLCKPLASGPPPHADVHVYSDGGGPWINTTSSGDTYDWRNFDMSVVTTIVRMAGHPITVAVDGAVQLSTKSAFGPADRWPESELVCTAHAHGVRVLVTVLPELKGPGSDPKYYQHLMGNGSAVQRMSDELAAIVFAAGWDGVEFDFEVMTREIVSGNTFDFGKAHVSMMNSVRQSLKKLNPHSTTALTLYGGNGGNPLYPQAYPAAALSQVVDQIFVMAYDMWHHHTVCAGPNSPLPGVIESIDAFVRSGVQSQKLIL